MKVHFVELGYMRDSGRSLETEVLRLDPLTKEQAQTIKIFEYLETSLSELKKSNPLEYKLYQGYKVFKSIKGE